MQRWLAILPYVLIKRISKESSKFQLLNASDLVRWRRTEVESRAVQGEAPEERLENSTPAKCQLIHSLVNMFGVYGVFVVKIN